MTQSVNAQMGGTFDPTRDINFTGAVDFGSSAPAFRMTVQQITATGATGSTAAAITASVPALILATGASGAGINFPTGNGVAGAFYLIKNMMTGDLKVYAVGGTINGSTGTTAATITATGNLTAFAVCSAAGVWQIGMQT